MSKQKPRRRPAPRATRPEQHPAPRRDRPDRRDNTNSAPGASEPENIVKRLRALRSPAERERTGTFYIEGARIVAQAINAGAAIELGVVAPELVEGGHSLTTVAALQGLGVPVINLHRAAFESISFKENLQGIGAVVRRRPETLTDVRPEAKSETRSESVVESSGLWVALDNVGNSGNLGAIMRTCDAVGCAGIMLLGSTVDAFHPATIRASMGSFFALRVVRAGFDEFATWKHANAVFVVGTTPDTSTEYRAVSYPPAPSPLVLLMGSERLGLTTAQQAVCDLLVRIPMVGTADSLNLGVATSVVLYEIFHQRRTPGAPADHTA